MHLDAKAIDDDIGEDELVDEDYEDYVNARYNSTPHKTKSTTNNESTIFNSDLNTNNLATKKLTFKNNVSDSSAINKPHSKRERIQVSINKFLIFIFC